MARLSLGRNEGTTNRATSTRLVGGEPIAASGGALATAALGAPAIQPQAAPVNTFQQTGAPTLGGPVRMFEPPAPPRPNQDLAALAESLQSFNSNLQQFTKSALQYDQQLEEDAKKRGATAAARVAPFGGFKDYGEAVREVEKRSGQDPSLTPLLTELRALDPRALPYANLEVADAFVKQRMGTLKEDFAGMSTLPDGRPLETVSPDDPAFMQLVTSKVLPQGLPPAAIARNQANLYSLFGSVRADQAKRYGDYKDERVRIGFVRGLSGDIALMQSGQIAGPDFAARLGQRLNDLYTNSRPGLYREQRDKLLDNIAEATVAAAAGDPNVLDRMAPAMAAALEVVPAGPNGEPLIDQFSKPREAVINDFYRKLMTGVNTDRELQDKRAQYRGEDTADADIQKYLPPEVLQNPAELQARIDALPQRAQQLFPNDVDAQLAYQSRVQSYANSQTRAYLAPVQRDTAAQEYARQAMNPSADPAADIQRYTQLFQTRQIDEADYKSLVAGARSRSEKANEQNYNTLRGLARDLQTRLTEQYKLTTEGDGTPAVTPKEAAEIRQAVGALYRKGEETIRKNPNANLDQELSNLFLNLTAPAEQKQKQRSQQPLYKSPADIGKLIGPGRGNQSVVNKVRTQAEKAPLYSSDIMAGQLDQILTGKPLDQQTRQVLRQLQIKPSDFFIKQMQLHGMPLTPEIQQQLRTLDGSDLVSSAQQPSQGPMVASSGLASRLWRQWSTAVGNAFIPSAAAAERDSSPFTGSTVAVRGPVNINRLRQAIVGKESGGSFSVVNADSGAIGLGQVMPENVGPWTQEHFGKRLTPAQFRANPKAQLAVVNGQLNKILQQQLSAGYDAATAIRRTASIWYSGRGDLYNDGKPQYSNGRRYPSIKEYTFDILRRYNRS